MNILFGQPFDAKNISAWSVHSYEVLSGLSRLGHNIVLLNGSPFPHSLASNIDRQPSQPSLWMRLENSLGWFRMLRPLRGEITILWLLLREVWIFFLTFITMVRWWGRLDIVYRRHHLFNSGYLLAKLFKLSSVKEVNGIVADETKITKRGDRVSLWVIDRIERFNMPKADKIIVVTAKLKEVLQEDYGVPGDKIIVIQNGANTDLFKPMDVIKAREELGLAQDRNYICFVGSLEPWQGVECLIRSMPRIVEECPQGRLLVIGDGPVRQELVELAKQIGVSDRIIFTGMVPYQEVPLYINAGDVCTSPKAGLKSGYSPLKLCEYMACGKPVVASRASGLEIVEDSGGGILVEPKDSAALAAAMIKLLQNQQLRKQMGENGRRYVVENQSWESVAKRVAEVCQSLVDSRRHGGKQ